MDTTVLHGLRLRTPRLELRLGSRDELVELGRLAERGIHPPEFMPFAVAWTDGIGKPGFLDDLRRLPRLELAFAGLGAAYAESSWLDGNHASRRVSEKLGYRDDVVNEISPRGTRVTQYGVRLGRSDWRAPVAVSIDGLEPCRPLFGAS